jgi:hypothetical protein
MSEAKPTVTPAAEPVLAQIPAGAPGRAYWFGVSVVIWVLWFGLLSAISRWVVLRGSQPQPDASFALGVAVGFLAPLLFHPWLQTAVMRGLGAPARLQRCRGRWIAVAERPLPRRAAFLVLLLPQLALLLLGLAALALGWLGAPVFVATAIASSTSERGLAVRLGREPGCTHVHFRRDGVVLYGTGHAFRPVSPASLWLTSLVMGAGWMLVALVASRGLIDAVGNVAFALRSRRDVIPYSSQPEWYTLKSRHQIWVEGPRLRIEVQSVPPEARSVPESLRAASVRVADPDGMQTISDGHALISSPDGAFLLQRGSRGAVRLKAGPIRSGSIPSVPEVDPALLSGWRPGRVGAARIGRYQTEIYERDGWIEGQRSATRLWVSPDLPVPVRIEEKLPHEEREETLRSIRFDLPLPDRLFRLPAGTVVQDLHPSDRGSRE